jgi:hypothetical protein
MPRTLDATLLAAMNAGGFTPYFNVQLLAADRSTVVFETTEVTGFTLDGVTAKVSFRDDAYINSYATFRIQRGVMIAGVPNIITSSQFYPFLDRYTKRIRSLEGHVFPIGIYSSTGDVSYGSIIATICAAYGLGVAYDDGAAAWISYQFYPTGRTFTLNDARRFFTILRQKYLVFATDNCNDELFFFQAKAVGPAYPAGYAPVYPGLAAIPGLGSYKFKSFLSRDENSTTHTSGDPGSPLHNLGFLPSTAVHPDCDFYMDSPDWFVTDISPNLKYRDFDALKVVFDNSVLALWPSRVREIFYKNLHPSWQWNCKYLDIFANTEGGAIPSSIEAAAPYTPINVTNFDKHLNSTVNNLQALADRVDELDTGPSIFASGNKVTLVDDDLIPIVDSTTVTHLIRNVKWSDFRSQAVHTSSRFYLGADQTGIPAGIGTRIDLNTSLYDPDGNFDHSNWYGAPGAYTQANAAGCSLTNIRKTGASFPASIVNSRVRWSSDAAGTLNLGTGTVTVVVDANNLTIVKGSGVDFANTYYFFILKAFYVVPSTGTYLICLNARIDPTEDQKRYNLSPYQIAVSLGQDTRHASGTLPLVSTYTLMCQLTVGDLISLLVSGTGLAASMTVKGGSGVIFASYTSMAIMRLI